MIYTGVCVGGLADGVERSHDKETMFVEQRKRLPDGTVIKTGERTEYRYLILLAGKHETIGVWVPTEIQDVERVVKRLVKHYKPLLALPMVQHEAPTPAKPH